MNYGLLSLLPPVVAVILAIWSKNVILSLFCGGFVGAMIFCGGNPFAAVHSMIGDYFFYRLYWRQCYRYPLYAPCEEQGRLFNWCFRP